MQQSMIAMSKDEKKITIFNNDNTQFVIFLNYLFDSLLFCGNSTRIFIAIVAVVVVVVIVVVGVIVIIGGV